MALTYSANISQPTNRLSWVFLLSEDIDRQINILTDVLKNSTDCTAPYKKKNRQVSPCSMGKRHHQENSNKNYQSNETRRSRCQKFSIY